MLDRASGTSAPAAGARYRKDLSLSDLKPGECGSVLRLNGIFCGRLRLLEMGLTPGTHVRMVRAAAFGGPVDIEVRGYQLSLRREEAAAVWLGEEDQP
jgi:Fe2+ transport system protein FeoA